MDSHKVTLEAKLLKVRKAPGLLHAKIEQWARKQGDRRKMNITKEQAIVELLDKATKNVHI